MTHCGKCSAGVLSVLGSRTVAEGGIENGSVEPSCPAVAAFLCGAFTDLPCFDPGALREAPASVPTTSLRVSAAGRLLLSLPPRSSGSAFDSDVLVLSGDRCLHRNQLK